MIFSKEKITAAYTLEICQSCSKEARRKFRQGDVLFAAGNACGSCNGRMTIEKIFGEETGHDA